MTFSYLARALCFCIMLLPVGKAVAQTPRLVVSAADTSANPASLLWLPIYLQNYDDEIAGVQIRLQSLNPQVAWFDLSGADFDTTGNLLSGWEYVAVVPLSGDSTGVKLAALANTLPDNHFFTPPIPSYGGGPLVPLIRIPIRTTASVPMGEESSVLDFVGLTEFSTPLAELIGVVTDTIIDTLYLLCTEREFDTCVTWTEVDPHTSPYDSLAVDTSLSGYIDSIAVYAVSGAVTVIESMGCDITLDSRVNLSDLTCLIQFLFNQNQPPLCLYYGNCNFGDPAELNLTDVTGLVGYLFSGGPPPQ